MEVEKNYVLITEKEAEISLQQLEKNITEELLFLKCIDPYSKQPLEQNLLYDNSLNFLPPRHEIAEEIPIEETCYHVKFQRNLISSFHMLNNIDKENGKQNYLSLLTRCLNEKKEEFLSLLKKNLSEYRPTLNSDQNHHEIDLCASCNKKPYDQCLAHVHTLIDTSFRHLLSIDAVIMPYREKYYGTTIIPRII